MSDNEMVLVQRDTLANLQASAAMGSRVGRAKEIVVTEAKALPSTVRSIAAPIGVGAVIAYIASLDDVKNSETLKKRWWLLPVVVLVVGYILKRRNSPHASTLLTAGAVLLIQAYKNRPKEEEKKAEAPAPNKLRAGGDTGAPAPIPTLHPIDDRTAWIQSNGQWVRVQLAAPIRQALPQPTAPSASAAVNDPAAALAAAAFAA